MQSDKHAASTKILLGYSMGARAALLHAVAYPKHWDALILISANPGIENEAARTERASSDAKLAQSIRDDGVPAFLEHWQQTPMIRSQQHIRADWLATMQRNRLQHTAEGLATSLEQFGPSDCPNLWPQLHQFACPTLLISGALDSKYCAIAKHMEAELPQAQWVSIPEVGHMPHLEAPEPTSAAIRGFIATLNL
jgi:2-succinyl-6-hydroxy-2,4-cyclohexadiene-1-carboxylate synthase